MEERNMMCGDYYQGAPDNMMYYNFGYQNTPNNLMGMNPNVMNSPNMMNNYQNPNIVDLNGNNSNPIIELNKKINNLENRVKMIEQKLGSTNYYQDDNSMYMI